tara:strand:- start:447 stop:1220 length:774 start_codon:yes stop_codon:yes gene_type:complete
MEININCDLGETSKFCSTENDPLLLSIVNSANIACGYHAGDKPTMKKTVEISKKNGVSIGAHPSFNDPENFGRKRINLSDKEINKLIIDQINILSEIAKENSINVTHVKPHGALNNMACENFDLANTIAKSIMQVNKELIFLVPTGSEMEKAAKKLDMKIAAEIFADRNYEDDGNLVSRSKSNALITDPEIAKKHVIKMVKNQALNCLSGKQISCAIDSICVHSDGKSAVKTAIEIRDGLLKAGVTLKPLDKLKKFA